MPKENERLWTDQELINLVSTISTLRQIRGAATYGMEPPKSGLLGWIDKLQKKPPLPNDRQQILTEGEDLARAAAKFMSLRILRDRRDSTHMDHWTELLHEATKNYKDYPSLTYANTKNAAVGLSTIAHIRVMSIDPTYLLHWDLFKGNKLGASNISELLQKKNTIVAPLSGDLLLSSLYQEQLSITRGETFPLKGAAFSKDLIYYVLPDLTHLEGSNEVGIFLDVIDSGKTGAAIHDTLKTNFPNLIIHKPQMQKILFEPNRKIRKAREAAEKKP